MFSALPQTAGRGIGGRLRRSRWSDLASSPVSISVRRRWRRFSSTLTADVRSRAPSCPTGRPLSVPMSSRASRRRCPARVRLSRTQQRTASLRRWAAASSVAGVELGGTQRVVIAGNSAMTALLSGADVSGLAAHPFAAPDVPDRLAATSVRAQPAAGLRRGLACAADGVVRGWGRACRLRISAGLVDVRVPTLLVDIGTNAEIVLALPGPHVVASAAAGPAFEGAGLASGGPATLGAVERVQIESENPVLHVIGGAEASWLSGAGFVSAVAVMLASGHILPNGAMNPHGPLAARFTRDDRRGRRVRALGEGFTGGPPDSA